MQPAPIAAWQGAGDPRRAITVDHLLRHTAGLALGSSLQASLGSALEPVNRMKFMESDMAAYAESIRLETPRRAPPGIINDGNTVILSHLIRNATRRTAADVMRFARQELFAPLGMRNVTLEFDASGTPEGSSQMLASARDWARFGMLYLSDGVVGGKRILPEGWVKYSASPTPKPGSARARASGPISATVLARPTAPSAAGRAMPSSPRARSGNMSSSCRPNGWSSSGSAARRTGRRKPTACSTSCATSSRRPAIRESWREPTDGS